MKKLKIFMYSLIALLVLPCAILFVACGKNEEAPKKETCAVILVVDGHQYKTEEVEKGTALTEAKLADLIGMTKTGYTFNGWYRDSALTEKYNYDSTVSSPLVLFCEYNINKYNVTYVLDNGADDIVIREDYGTALPTPSKPVRAGYTFVGWDKDIPTTMPAEDTTITACWRHFSVSVDTNIEGACTLADYTITNVMPGVEDIGGTLNVDITSVNLGYTFRGWYIGESCRSTSKKYAHLIETNNTELVARFKIDDALANFNFTSTPETLTITGVKDRDASSVVVPSYVTEIKYGAFAGMKYLQTLDLPFIGGIAGAKATSPSSPFGYIFGDADENDDVYFAQFKQTISYKPEGSSASTSLTQTFYGPLSLTNLILHQTSYFTGVFQNLEKLTNLENIYFAGSIAAWINASMPSYTANPMSGSVAKHFYYLDDGNYVKLQTLVLPAGTKEIRQNTLTGFSDLTKVVLNNELKKISQNAFKDFAKGDIEFYYIGTQEQFAEITISSGNNVLTDDGAKVYYYLEEATSEQIAEGIYWHYVGGEITLWS